MTAALGAEEMRAELPVGPEQKEGEADRRHREQVSDRDRDRTPCEDRHARERHPGRPHPQERDDEIRRPNSGRHAEKDHAERIEVDVRAGVVFFQRVGDVAEPAVIRNGVGEQACIHEEAGCEVDPVGEGVQPRERHVTRPKHERKEIVAEPREHRLRVEENHRDRVSRKKLIVLFRRDQRLIGTRKLQTDHKRFQSADDEEDERRDEISDADLLVIDGRDPTVEARLRRPDCFERGGGRRVRNRRSGFAGRDHIRPRS